MDIRSLQFAARYPFTPAAKEFLRGERSVDWSVMERAAQRVADAQRGAVSYIETNDRRLLEREILSFPIAKAIASLCTRANAARWISGEVRRAMALMRESWGRRSEGGWSESGGERKGEGRDEGRSEGSDDVQRFAEQFGIHLSGLTIDIKSYLKFIPKERSAQLVLQDVRAGRVVLSENRLFEVLAEASAAAIQQGFPIPLHRIPTSILQDVKDFATQINEKFKVHERKLRAHGELAPCMAQIIRALEAGEKVPHSARWIIATYLLRRGVGEERIIELFRPTPNFNEKRTRYYIDHIKKKGYSVPTCAAIDGYSLCVARCGIRSPLQYWGKK